MSQEDADVEVFPPVPVSALPTLSDEHLAECVYREDPGSIEEQYRRDATATMNYILGLEQSDLVESREHAARMRARIEAMTPVSD